MATRRERVLLELEDHFSSQMVKPIAATKALDAALDSLSGSSVRTSRDQDAVTRSTKDLGNEVDKTSTKVRRGSSDIDRYGGRLRLLTEAAVLLGPALVPIGAVGIPAVVGLTAGLGAAVAAAGVAVLAFHGVGDALKALDAYQLTPSAANLKKMNEEFEKIGPAGVGFVKFLDDLEPQLKNLQELTRLGLFPGVEAGLSSLMTLLPQVRLVVFDLATEFGRLSAEAGGALAGPGFASFFHYLETDAAPTLAAFAHTLGNVAEGFGSLLVAFAPMSRGFAAGMESMSRSFANWAAGLSQTDGFRSFVAYIRESGPQVIALLGSMATAFIAIVRAAAPVGAAVLPALTALANVLAKIANSPIGPSLFTAVAALTAVSRATTIATAGYAKLKVSADSATASMSKMSVGVNFVAVLTGIGAVDAAFNSLHDTINETDLTRNLEALARGGTVDDLRDIGKNIDAASASWTHFTDGLSDVLSLGLDTSELEAAQKEVEKVDQALASLVESGHADIAAKAFDVISAQALAAGASTDDVASSLDAYTLAVANLAPATKQTVGSVQQMIAADRQSAKVAHQARTAVAGLTEAMQEQTKTALDAFDAVTQYNRALDDAQKQAKKSEAGISAATEAGRKNRDALSALAGAWNNQSDTIKNNVGKWREAKSQFVEVAKQMGVNEDKAKKLAASLLEIPQSVVTRIDAKADPALAAIMRIKKELASVPREVRTTYYVNQVNSVNRRYDPSTGLSRAGGGPIYGPGTKTSDDVPVMASRGEFMMSAAAVDHYGLGTMFAMNARHLAGGGSVDHTTGHGMMAHQFGPDSLWGLSHEADAAAHSLAGLGQMGKHEVEQRGKFLDHEQALAQKALDTAKARLDEERGALKDLRAARDDFARSVSQNFRSDVFGGDLATQATNGALGSDFGNSVYAFAQQQMTAQGGAPQAYNIADWVQQYLDSLTPSQLAALQAQAAGGTLQQDAASANTFSSLLAQLRGMGLTGGAYRDLASSGNLGQAQAFASMSPEAIAALVASYQERERALHRLEGRAGDAAFGRQIEKQTKIVQQQVNLTAEIRDQSRELNRLSHSIDQRLAQLNRIEAKQAKDTGQAVAQAINHGAASANGRP